jgi:hypothetical protein
MRVSNFKLGIGVPCNFPMLSSWFFDSFIIMEKPDYVYLRSTRGNIDNMRNELATEAIKSGCSHIIMLDADQVYHPKTITRLLSHRIPVVGCLVYRRYPPFDPLMVRGSIGGYTAILEWEPNSLVEVDATGTGCILFEMDIFSKMPYPWFRFRQGPYGAPVGEDFGFCYDLRQKGYKIYVDTSVPAGHLSQMEINEGTWKLYNRMKEVELKFTNGLDVKSE